VPPDRGTHDHARAPAERGVVDGAVDVMRPVTQIVYPDVDDAAVDGASEERDTERGQVLGEDGDDVEAQGRRRADRFCGGGHDPPRSSRPSGGSITHVPASRSTVGTISVTNGTSASLPSSRRMPSSS